MSVTSLTSSPDPRPGRRPAARCPWLDLAAMVGLARTPRPSSAGGRGDEDDGDLTELAARLALLFK